MAATTQETMHSISEIAVCDLIGQTDGNLFAAPDESPWWLGLF
jgi:hypothetical protein